MTSMVPGTTFGNYEVVEAIGKGGMGEVYRARDKKLGRQVAIKVLPRLFSDDEERLARFKREAQVLASLNHPNIATLHGLEEHDGTLYLVMELVEGETLAEHLARGPLAMEEVRSIATAICEALEEAHEKGIVHRDLKPANVKITPEGRVKVLDFGLAKAFVEDTEAVDNSLSPTITRDATRAGVILGTAAYMSPEQARGKPVDKRSDIFSFGSVLYEMVTGARAFEGEMVSDVLAAVIKTEPDWLPLPDEITPLVKRCMDKDPRDRFRDIGDVRYELSRPTSSSPTETKRGRWWWPSVAAGAAVVVAFGLGLFLSRTNDRLDSSQVVRSTLLPPEGEQFFGSFGLALSPDGSRLAFADARVLDRRRLWIRHLDGLEAVPLEGTEGVTFPFWSPDGRWIGFFADNELKIVSASGGAPRTVADAPGGVGGTWSEDGVILFASDPFKVSDGFSAGGMLFRVPAVGGEPTRLTVPGDRVKRPTFLPDGRHFLFHGWTTEAAVYVGDLQTGEVRAILQDAYGATFAPGWVLSVQGRGAVFARRFDSRTLELQGDPMFLVDGVANFSAHAAYSVSARGQLVYQPEPSVIDSKIWTDREGAFHASLPEDALGGFWTYRISPSGRELAVGGLELGIVDLDRGIFQRMSQAAPSQPVKLMPAWSPDGDRIAYVTYVASTRGQAEIRIAAAEGGDESLFRWDGRGIDDLDWSPDGETLLVSAIDSESEGKAKLWMVRVGDASREVWLETDGNVTEGRFSPNGKWVAYRSDETGLSEVYIRRFPGPGAATRVSTSGGAMPTWRRDGRELFYVDLDGEVIAVGVETGETLRLSTPEPLFEVGTPWGADFTRYDVAPNGQEFLVNQETGGGPVTLVQNWPQLLRP